MLVAPMRKSSNPHATSHHAHGTSDAEPKQLHPRESNSMATHAWEAGAQEKHLLRILALTKDVF